MTIGTENNAMPGVGNEAEMIEAAVMKTDSHRRSIILSFFANAWTAVLGLVFVPFYLRYIGVEAYGVIGFFASVQAILSLLDLGLSPSFSREISRLKSSDTIESAARIRSLTRTVGAINWGLTAVVTIVLICLSPVLARDWVNGVNLSVRDITECFLCMSLSFAAQFPQGLYNAGLAGLQRQVSASVIGIIFGTLRSVGALGVLVFISPSIKAFLIWQAAIALFQVAATVITFRSFLPKGALRNGAFDLNLIRPIWRFAAGNLAIAVTGLLVSQSDRFVLTKMVSLEEFGYYSLATMISSTGLVMLVAAVTKVAYPQFSRLVAAGNDHELRQAYHQNSQLVSLLIIPATVVLAVFSREILYVWTGNNVIADKTSLVLALYSVGMGLNCLLWLPNSMQLAHGWTRLTFYKNLFVLAFFIPLLFWTVSKYGIVGGAASWMGLNLIYFVGYVMLMHRKILKGEALNWYLRDIGIPLIASVPIALAGRYAIAPVSNRIGSFLLISLIGCLTLAAAAMSTEFLRGQVSKYLFSGQNLRLGQT